MSTTTGLLASYSREEVLERLLVHERSFALDPETAYDLAALSVKPMAAQRADALFLMDDCGAMILADGIAEPAEFQALHKIKTILGLESAFERRQNWQSRGPFLCAVRSPDITCGYKRSRRVTSVKFSKICWAPGVGRP
jgi:hypothetical protein